LFARILETQNLHQQVNRFLPEKRINHMLVFSKVHDEVTEPDRPSTTGKRFRVIFKDPPIREDQDETVKEAIRILSK
jgi:hypothetical protein